MFKENELRYHQIVQGLPVAMYTCDADGYINLYNEAAAELWGREPELGKDLWCGSMKIYNKDGSLLSLDEFPMAIVLKEGRIVSMEIIIERPDGERRHIKPHPHPILDENGKVVGAVNMLIDITEQKRSQQHMEENEIRLRLATEGTKLATWDLGLDTREIVFSPRLAEIFGHPAYKKLTHDELRGQIHPDDLPIVKKAFEEAMRTGVYEYEGRVIKPDKTICWIRTQGKVIFDAQHHPWRMLGTMEDITELRDIDEQMGKLAAIVQSSHDAIISKTLEGFITSWNEGAQNIFGYTAEEMIGQHITKLIPPDRISEETEILDMIRKGKRVSHFETKRLAKDKTLIDISLTISPVKDSKGNIIGASKIARDISVQKKALRILEEAEQRQNLALASAELGAWDYDFRSKRTVRNLRHEQIFGYKEFRVEWNLDSFLEHVYPEDRHIMEECIQHGIIHGNFSCEVRILHTDGSLRWIKVQARIFYNESKQPVRMLGTVMDITEQKTQSERLEKMVEERTRELLKQKEFVDSILDAAVDVIAVFNTDLQYLSLNKKAYEVYGVSKENIIGKHILEVFPLVKYSGMYDNLKKALKGKTIHDQQYKSPIINRHFENFYIPLKYHDGEVYGVMMVGHENTAIVEAAEKLKTTNHILEEKNAALERSNKELESFSYVASHDLQEPLRKIQTFADLLKNNRDNEVLAETYLDKIKSSSERMSDLIKSVLNYSRLARTKAEPEEVDLNTIIEEVKMDFELLLEEKKVRIEHTDLPVIKGISLQLNQLFSNMLSNSVKFSDKDPVINISSEILTKEQVVNNPLLNPEQEYVEIKFADNGIGFEQQYADKIFTIFQRLHDKLSYVGTGIGLALCKKIVENHGGVITAQSELGKGAVFTMWFPKL